MRLLAEIARVLDPFIDCSDMIYPAISPVATDISCPIACDDCQDTGWREGRRGPRTCHCRAGHDIMIDRITQLKKPLSDADYLRLEGHRP